MFPFPPEFFFFLRPHLPRKKSTMASPLPFNKCPPWRPNFVRKMSSMAPPFPREKCSLCRPHSPGKNVLYCAPHFQGKNVLCGASIPPGKMSVPATVTLHFFIVQVAEAMFGPNMRVEGPRVVEDPKKTVGYKIKLPFMVFRHILINH